MIIHNIKVALRNLMKYKLQTLISVISIAIGIVTLSFAQSLLECFRLPSLYNEPYQDRTYNVLFHNGDDGNPVMINREIIQAMRKDGLPRSAEQLVMPNGGGTYVQAEFHLNDSSIRKGMITEFMLDPAYANLLGIRSVITGKKIKVLQRGEAIISEDYAKELFKDKNPVGAIQIMINERQTVPVTIVDVFERISEREKLIYTIHNNGFYCWSEDNIENSVFADNLYAVYINMVMKDGCSEGEFLKEINERVKPLGYEAQLTKMISEESIDITKVLHILVYLISSLILLAALIGYFRVQTQLFWIRRREISLRIVNGADRNRIFVMLLTELIIPIVTAVLLAVCLGNLLEDFVSDDLGRALTYITIRVGHLWLNSLIIGAVLFLISAVIAWITLLRINKRREGLAANMRGRRNHLLRYISLTVQIIISIIFVSAVFVALEYGEKTVEAFRIPENNGKYMESLTTDLSKISQPERCMNEIRKIPELADMLICGYTYVAPVEFAMNPEVKEKLDNKLYFPTYFSNDTVLLSYLGVEVEWFGADVDHNRGILISEKLYDMLEELDIPHTGRYAIHNGKSADYLPINGIFKNLPYDRTGKQFIAITPDVGYKEVILLPKPGEGKALQLKVNEIIESLEPEIMNIATKSFVEKYCPEYLMVKALLDGIMILGIVSLIICAMSIYSTIALETRSRIKEMAIRKVNGAKSKDIYTMFGRIYLVLILISAIIAIPLCLKLNILESFLFDPFISSEVVSSVMPTVCAVGIVTLLIFLIISLQIHKVMKVDPAKIIAKE